METQKEDKMICMQSITSSNIYKYQPVTEYSLKNLKEKKLWFSRPDSFNDPFDCGINFTIVDVTEENLQSLFFRMLKLMADKNKFRAKYAIGDRINNQFRNDAVEMARMVTKSLVSKKNFGVTCFSENNNNILMWSHYSGSHQGFCLEFDTHFAPFKSENTLLRVNYCEVYPSLSINKIPHELPSIPQTIYGIKSHHWSYEKEWRLFLHQGNQSYSFDPSALTGVYFGCKMKETDKHELTKILADFPSVKMYQLQRSESEFQVFPQETIIP